MRKALIKLILKWAYRCKHDWKLLSKKEKQCRNVDGMYIDEYRDVFTYRCTKCNDSSYISVDK
jgi:hypothetical protein